MRETCEVGRSKASNPDQKIGGRGIPYWQQVSPGHRSASWPVKTQEVQGDVEERTACKSCEGGRPHLSVNDEPSANIEAVRMQEQQSLRCSNE